MNQFHGGGVEATEKLAQLLYPSRGSCVLDVGREGNRGLGSQHIQPKFFSLLSSRNKWFIHTWRLGRLES